MKILENKQIRVEISSFGAEIQSVQNRDTGFEYIWCGDKKFWGRHSPVLFPIVGKVWNGHMKHKNKEYAISQHGFARDREFDELSEEETIKILGINSTCKGMSVGYVLHSDAESREKLPFDFDLYIIYQLLDNELTIYWKVDNKTDGDMYFQIGAHPAFNYKDFDSEAKIQGYLHFDRKEKLAVTRLENGGFASPNRVEIMLEENSLPISKETFSGDALVVEHQVNRVTLRDRDGNSYVEVEFDTPVVGLWSPAKTEYAPFVCIEPWYGRCDPSGFDGDFSEKPYINRLEKGETFESKYKIIFK